MQEASLEEGPVLRLILDYFERAGHAECLVSLENYCRENVSEEVLKSGSFPLELAALRELSLQGKWEQVVQYLNAFSGCSDEKGLERCLYLAERQKYFEILHHIESSVRSKFRLGYTFPENLELLSSKEVDRTQKVIQHQLSVLERLSPSEEEFLLLNNIFTSALSSSSEFSTWDLHSGRLETFYRIGEWVSKVLYLTISFPKKSNKEYNLADKESCSLLRLVAKGLLYEQCEKLCRLRCGEKKELSDDSSKLLDLSSWIQQQPDSSFQSRPAEIALVVKPLKSQQSGRKKGHDNCKSDFSNNKPGDNSDQDQARNNSIFKIKDKKIEQTATESMEAIEPAKSSPVLSSNHTASPSTTDNDLETRNKRNSSTPRNYKVSEASLQSSLPPSPIIPAGFKLEDADNQSQPAGAINSGYARQNERTILNINDKYSAATSSNSHDIPHSHSPPKPSTPVTCVMESHYQATREGKTSKDGFKIQRKRVEEEMNSEIVTSDSSKSTKRRSTSFKEWSEIQPSVCDGSTSSKGLPPNAATLVGTISDKQVVRSVAFSESGSIVAVGANSRTLRLCHTHPLLDQNRNPSELDAFYVSPQYHKSSIYCLAWFQDSILASGSNDQSIRLLTSTAEHKIATHRPLEIHKGTIRDLCFTPEGLLVSGGGRVPEVLVTDPKNSQIVLSLTGGHVDQILAVGALSCDLVVSGSQDGTVCIWDLRSRNTVSGTHLHSGVTSLTSCGREGLVAAHIDGSCSVFDLRSQQCTATYTAHQGECRSVRTLPLQTRVLSGSYDGTVCLANVAPSMADATERVQWKELCRHNDKVIQCRWHPTGRLFASTGTDKKACFWSI